MTSAAVLLVENDNVLRLRASAGLYEATPSFEQRVGEGFAGTVAARRAPIALANAAEDPLVISEAIRAKKVRALFGVPLIHGDTLVGVAHIGSVTASSFSDEDMLLFRLMADRATAVIVQAVLARNERAARAELEVEHRRVVDLAAAEGAERMRAQHIATELDAARRVAEEAGALLDTLLARAPIGVAFLDADLRYLRVNDALAASNGASAAAHLGRRPSEVVQDRAAAKRIEAAMHEALLKKAAVVAQETTLQRGDEPPTHWLMSYYPIASVSGAMLGVGKIAVDVTDQKNAADRQRFLAEASHLLSRSLALTETLQALARLAVPALADWCAIDLRDDSGQLRSVVVMHVDEAKRALAMRLRQEYPSETTALIERTLARGETEFYPQVDPAVVAATSKDEQHRALRLALDPRSLIATPLRARGRLLGALTIIRGSGRASFTTTDVELIEDLATRAALAADNAALYEEAERVGRMREQIVAVVSHDLRSPLQAIGIAARLIETRATVWVPETLGGAFRKFWQVEPARLMRACRARDDACAPTAHRA